VTGQTGAALFAQKVRPARSTEIHFPVDDAPHSTNSKHEPDASFWHDDAQYPGVIIEVAYSQKRKRLDRLAEDYLLDSDASVRVVVGLDIEYGKKGLRKATISVWRTHVAHTDAKSRASKSRTRYLPNLTQYGSCGTSVRNSWNLGISWQFSGSNGISPCSIPFLYRFSSPPQAVSRRAPRRPIPKG
jgi:hypothetical protein